MLLRRITKHVTEQNWFAVGLDFFIVVFGVFVGLQVANWNEERADDVRESAYLKRIQSDLDQDLNNYKNNLAFWSKVTDYGISALSYANTNQSGDNSHWELLLAFFQSSQTDEFNTTDTTYKELTSAGDLRLIDNIAIRKELSKYYTNSGNPALTEQPAYRRNVRGYIPVSIQSYIWENCYRANLTDKQEMFACDSPIPQTMAHEIISGISSDIILMRELRYWMSTLKVASLISNGRIRESIFLIEMIEQELQQNNHSN